jgi:hypothetical protein
VRWKGAGQREPELVEAVPDGGHRRIMAHAGVTHLYRAYRGDALV